MPELTNQNLPQKFLEVCELIANTGAGVDVACAQINWYSDQFYKLLRKSDLAQREYVNARENRAHHRFESVQNLLNEVKTGEIEPHAARVVLDGIKWLTGKEKASMYGDSMTLKGDKNNPIEVNLGNLLENATARRATLIEQENVIDAEYETITKSKELSHTPVDTFI